jgi:Lar family restriction alleviation protein
MTKPDEKLRACPFCGGEAILDTWDEDTESRHIKCSHCGCQTRGFFRRTDAYDEWNTRQSPVVLDEGDVNHTIWKEDG